MKTVEEYIQSLSPGVETHILFPDMLEISERLFGAKLDPPMRNYGLALGVLHLMEPILEAEAEGGVAAGGGGSSSGGISGGDGSPGSIMIGGISVPLAGGVASLKEGDLSVSFTTAAKSASTSSGSGASIDKTSLSSTKWGALLWQLISANSIFMGVLVS